MNGVGTAFNFDGKGCISVGSVVLSWLWHFGVQSAPPGLVGLVGRRPELAAISAAAKAAADHRPSVVWIEGLELLE